jgi:hypothetical protein
MLTFMILLHKDGVPSSALDTHIRWAWTLELHKHARVFARVLFAVQSRHYRRRAAVTVVIRPNVFEAWASVQHLRLIVFRSS